MLRKTFKLFFLLFLLVLLLLFLPHSFVDKMRVKAFSLLAPLLKKCKEIAPFEKLQTENHLLRLELGKLCMLVQEKELLEKWHKETAVLPAFVIYRDPALWMSSFWVDVGRRDNERKGEEIISLGSPALVGNAVVGVVDYVGEKQSRVRLITDTALKPSVRVARGLPQNAAFIQHIDSILSRIQDPYVVAYLENVRKSLEEDGRCWYLAKGVICGSSCPLWRDRTKSLKGYGFNYDFPDSFGPAKELRGEDLGEAPIILENDLLVTTGMDGVFPRGLAVAEVTKVYPLREGGYSYDIEATPVVKNLDSLQMVFIIPKVGIDLQENEDCFRK